MATIQEMFDFSLQELKERLKQKIRELDATSSTPLTKAVLWTSQPFVWDPTTEVVQTQAPQEESLTLFVMAQHRTSDQIVCQDDPIIRIPCSGQTSL